MDSPRFNSAHCRRRRIPNSSCRVPGSFRFDLDTRHTDPHQFTRLQRSAALAHLPHLGLALVIELHRLQVGPGVPTRRHRAQCIDIPPHTKSTMYRAKWQARVPICGFRSSTYDPERSCGLRCYRARAARFRNLVLRKATASEPKDVGWTALWPARRFTHEGVHRVECVEDVAW
jgi:hypothetical protein